MTAYFSNIRNEILVDLANAQNEIRIAVAWFTNQELFDVLIKKLHQKIKISLIIIDDYINNGDMGLNFQEFINQGGLLFYGDSDHPMHNKYCIIDNQILLTGSYNWTYYAENKNSENLLKVDDTILIQRYFDDFMFLLSKSTQISVAHKTKFQEIENRYDYFSTNEYVHNDVLCKSYELNDMGYVEKLNSICPKDYIIDSVDVKLKSIIDNRKIYRVKNSIGIETYGGFFSPIIPINSNIPYCDTYIYNTVFKDQTGIGIAVYYGENSKASMNKLIKSFSIKDIPPKPAGEASISVCMTLEYTKLTVLVKCLDNGETVKEHKNLSSDLFTLTT